MDRKNAQGKLNKGKSAGTRIGKIRTGKGPRNPGKTGAESKLTKSEKRRRQSS